MEAFVATALDLVLVAVIVQGGVLAWHWRKTGRGVPPAPLAANLAAGWFLILAVRLALAGSWSGWIGAVLLAAFVAHLVDLRLRWR